MTDKVKFKNLYIAVGILGKGNFGEVYSGISKITNESVAIKIEPKRKKRLWRELEVYRKLGSSTLLIPKLIDFISGETNNILIIELCSNALDSMFKSKYSSKMPLDKVKIFLKRGIDILEFLHDNGIIHRDIKPSNFLYKKCHTEENICIADFGLSKFYIEKSTGNHIPIKKYSGIVGTPRFISLNVHRYLESSRRDDLESLLYTGLFLLEGKLPWQKTAGTLESIFNTKCKTSLEKLCFNFPKMAIAIEKVRKMEFSDKPDYFGLKLLF